MPIRKDWLMPWSKGRIVFTSCQGEQKSWIRPDSTLSFYTQHLIEVLQGAASQPEATEGTVFDLANHLDKAVPDSAAVIGMQHYPRFEMAEAERFVIALLQRGKGLPAGRWKAVKHWKDVSNQMPVSASGERIIAIGGSATGSTIITGDNNVARSGKVIQRDENKEWAILWAELSSGSGRRQNLQAQRPYTVRSILGTGNSGVRVTDPQRLICQPRRLSRRYWPL